MGRGAHRITRFSKAFPEVEQQAIARRTRLFPGEACELQRTSGRQYSVSGVQVSFRGGGGFPRGGRGSSSCLCKTTGKVVRQAKLSQSPFLVFGVQSAVKTCLFTSPG